MCGWRDVWIHDIVILDEVVVTDLHEVWPGAKTAGWYPDTYVRYCSFIGRWADLATDELNGERKVRADEIDYALFHRYPAKRRSARRAARIPVTGSDR